MAEHLVGRAQVEQAEVCQMELVTQLDKYKAYAAKNQDQTGEPSVR